MRSAGGWETDRKDMGLGRLTVFRGARQAVAAGLQPDTESHVSHSVRPSNHGPASAPRPFPRPALNPRMDRDLIGYGANPPNPNWPGAARLAVNFVLNFEEGSEPSIGDGDPASESRPD